MASDIQPGIETLGMPVCPLYKPPWIFGLSCQLYSKHCWRAIGSFISMTGESLCKILKVCCLSFKDWWGGRLSWPSQHGEQAPPKWCGGAECMMSMVHLRIWIISLSSDTAISGFRAMFMGTSYSFPMWCSGSFSWDLMSRNQPVKVIQKCLTLLKMFKMAPWSCCHSRCRAQMGPGCLEACHKIRINLTSGSTYSC